MRVPVVVEGKDLLFLDCKRGLSTRIVYKYNTTCFDFKAFTIYCFKKTPKHIPNFTKL